MQANLLTSVRHQPQRLQYRGIIFLHYIRQVMAIFIRQHHYYIYLMEQNGHLMEVYYLVKAIRAARALKEIKALQGNDGTDGGKGDKGDTGAQGIQGVKGRHR